MARGDSRRIAVAALVTFGLAAAVSAYLYTSHSRRVQSASEDRLLLAVSLRTVAMESYLASVRSQMQLWSEHGPVREAALTFANAWDRMEPGAGRRLQRLYLEENPNPAGRKQLLHDAGDGSPYSVLHAGVHPGAKRFIETLGYYDVFLFDERGNLLYTYYKEPDFATNLETGPWRDTHLANAFRKARDAEDASTVVFTDLRPYEPSGGALAAFMASPITLPDGRRFGVLAVQVSSERIGEIVGRDAAVDKDVQTLLVGPDQLVRSDPDSALGFGARRDTEAVRRALAGEEGVLQVEDETGSWIAAYGPANFEGIHWALVTRVPEASLREPTARLRRLLLGACIVAGLLAGIATRIGLFTSASPLQSSPMS